MDQYEMIRTGCRVYGQNISEMARMTGHSRNTVKKAIRGEPCDIGDVHKKQNNSSWRKQIFILKHGI